MKETDVERVSFAEGMPGFPFGGESPAQEVERSDHLRAVIAATPKLQGYAEKPLDEHGVNIEGLAVRGDRLFLGFRGPVINGKAQVMSVDIGIDPETVNEEPRKLKLRRLF